MDKRQTTIKNPTIAETKLPSQTIPIKIRYASAFNKRTDHLKSFIEFPPFCSLIFIMSEKIKKALIFPEQKI